MPAHSKQTNRLTGKRVLLSANVGPMPKPRELVEIAVNYLQTHCDTGFHGAPLRALTHFSSCVRVFIVKKWTVGQDFPCWRVRSGSFPHWDCPPPIRDAAAAASLSSETMCMGQFVSCLGFREQKRGQHLAVYCASSFPRRVLWVATSTWNICCWMVARRCQELCKEWANDERKKLITACLPRHSNKWRFFRLQGDSWKVFSWQKGFPYL